MVVCQFFQRGNCRFGSQCKNEHPGQKTLAAPAPASAGAFSAESIKQDLTTERPLWALTSYGPAKNEPNLIAGIDLSQEELRWEYVQAVKANNPAMYRKST
jgi:nucleoporin NUP42